MKKGKIKKATKGLFNRFFGFENGIDITDEVKVLHRRNVVIKNIVFVSNLFYSLILFIIAATTQKPSDWLFTLLFFPFTFFLNAVIKKLLYGDTHDKTKQEVGMYLLATYMFISSLLFYARFYENQVLETATYILIYYAVVVISLYTSRKLTLWSTFGMLVSMTIIHFTWTYRISDTYRGMPIDEFFSVFTKTNEFADILLRTTIFLIFSMVVYAIVSIGQYLQDERRNELIKRRELQTDFTTITSDLFKVLLSSKSSFLDRQHFRLVGLMSVKLASLYGLTDEDIEYIKEYSQIHLRVNEIEDLVYPDKDNEPDFNVLKAKTVLGNQIAKRLQLAQKAEDIARAHIEGVATEEFIFEIKKIQPDIHAQIILVCDLYVTMRSSKSYKRPYANNVVIDLFKNQFNNYFEYPLLDRFLKFRNEFETMYNEY